jgi:hypothetical protein
MKSSFALLTLLFFGLLAHADEPMVKPALSSFLDAIKRGDADLAINSVYQPPGAEQRTQARVRMLAQKASSKGAVPEYVDASVQATISIAITKDVAKRADGNPDFDAMLLLKRDGKWLVVLGIAEVEDRADVLTGDERKQLAQLRQWQDIRMRELSPSN